MLLPLPSVLQDTQGRYVYVIDENSIAKKKYIDTYRKKSSIIGKEVDVYVGNEIISGVATDIDENANLVVRGENGQSYVFGSGEARVRKAAK